MTAPRHSPRTLPSGPACLKYVLLVTTSEPQPTLVPMANARTVIGDKNGVSCRSLSLNCDMIFPFRYLSIKLQIHYNTFHPFLQPSFIKIIPLLPRTGGADGNFYIFIDFFAV